MDRKCQLAKVDWINHFTFLALTSLKIKKHLDVSKHKLINGWLILNRRAQKHCRWSSVSNSKSWLKVFLIQHDIITIPHDPRLNIPWETNSASLKTGSNWSAAQRRHRFNPWRDEGGRKKKKTRGWRDERRGRRRLAPWGHWWVWGGTGRGQNW